MHSVRDDGGLSLRTTGPSSSKDPDTERDCVSGVRGAMYGLRFPLGGEGMIRWPVLRKRVGTTTLRVEIEDESRILMDFAEGSKGAVPVSGSEET